MFVKHKVKKFVAILVVLVMTAGLFNGFVFAFEYNGEPTDSFIGDAPVLIYNYDYLGYSDYLD